MYFGYSGSQAQHPHSMSLPSFNYTNNKSILLEPKVVTLQRDSENYIRKVEQEKKHYYNVEETFMLVFKEWKEKKEKMKEIQKYKSNPSTKLLQSKIKNLENELEQSISKLNQTQSQNSSLQKQIDSLRKERVQCLHIHEFLIQSIQKAENKQAELEGQNESDQQKTFEMKEQIAQLKQKNDSEKDIYIQEFDKLQQEAMDEKRQREASKLAARKEKIENIDTATLMKLRLKRIIANNKEKVKVIEHYLKNMRVIDEAFTQIKEASGITDIEEIQNTFIKSEEQNYSLYKVVDDLSQEIDREMLTNEELRKKIQKQEEENEIKMRQLKATPAVERERRKKNQTVQTKQKQIDSLRSRMEEISPELQQVLVELAQTELTSDKNMQYDYQLAFNLNESSLELYLQDLEYYINILIAKQKLALNQSVVNSTLLLDQIPQKEFRTPRVGQPIGLDEIPIDQTKLLQQSKIKDLIVEAIEKKRKG